MSQNFKYMENDNLKNEQAIRDIMPCCSKEILINSLKLSINHLRYDESKIYDITDYVLLSDYDYEKIANDLINTVINADNNKAIRCYGRGFQYLNNS